MTLSLLDRYDGDAVPDLGDQAVVLGGSIAGLCAARVLRDCFDEVVVLERDTLPEGAATRDGAPQTDQPHAMLEAGRVVLAMEPEPQMVGMFALFHLVYGVVLGAMVTYVPL